MSANTGVICRLTAISVKKIIAKTVCRSLNQSENIAGGVLNEIHNLTPSCKAAGIDFALRNLEYKLGLVTKKMWGAFNTF